VRLVEVVAILLFLAGCVLIARAAWRAVRLSRSAGGAGWEPYHRYDGDCRRVYVRRGEELEPIGEIEPAEADYETAFLVLMDRARERAAMLNSER
jgi:hypothetical protein